MARCHLVFLTLVLSVVQSYGSQVPVFLWGDLPRTSLKANPLITVDPEEFGHIVTEELKAEPFTVVFIEETLSVEDFSRKDADGKTLFPFLRSHLRESYYLPSVQNALRVLNKVGDTDNVDHVKLTDTGLSADLEATKGKFLFINLKDAREGESRADMLKRHNDFMKEVYQKLQERFPSIIGVYTAHYPSWTVTTDHSRVRRQVGDTALVGDYVVDGLRLYASSITYTSGTTSGTLTTLLSSSSTYNATIGSQSSTLNFNDGVTLVLNFAAQMGYWYFESIGLTKDGNTQTLVPNTNQLYAPNNYSYQCGLGVNFTAHNDTSHSVSFVDLRVEPFFEARNQSDMDFSQGFDCIGYFDTTILACLMIVFLLLAILFYGVMMMMDIRTMDRFDDPKGKTITINPME
ncbi:V-type proton ATPase subunit S1 [Amyelois transitella]|uniref:V-type proton ATPase subunit S1 n=1 Tax=Amyelois transitella TaxID=680683 RepID=UPI00298F5BDC|nr:V-type proton ATPase subunit S1 [Amyelois transitella]